MEIVEAMQRFDVREFSTKTSSNISASKSWSGLCVTLAIKPHTSSGIPNVRESLI
jgi:hypothetical protein